MRIGGQHFSAPLLGQLREALASGLHHTRSALARQVCDWLGWRNAAGRPCEMAARKALVELERRGEIALPPPRTLPPQQRKKAPEEPWPGLEFSGTLDALGPMELIAVEGVALASIWR